jgi:hypothetical protein
LRAYFVVCGFCKRIGCRSKNDSKTNTAWWFDGFKDTFKWQAHMQQCHDVKVPDDGQKFNVCEYEEYI